MYSSLRAFALLFVASAAVGAGCAADGPVGARECYHVEWGYVDNISGMGVDDIVEIGGDRPSWLDPICDLPTPCAEAAFKSSWCGNTDAEEVPYDPEIATCILESVRDDVPGYYRIYPYCDYNHRHITIQVFGDGTLIWTVEDWGEGEGGKSRWMSTPDADYFAGCNVDDEGDWYACMRDIYLVGDCRVGNPSC